MGSSPIASWQKERGNLEAVTDFFSFASKTTADNDCTHEIKRCLFLERKAMTNLDNILKSRDINFQKVCIVKAMFFPSNHVWMWELNHKEGWGPKNWCLQIMVLEKTLDSALDCKIKPVNLKGNHPWILIGRTDTKAKAPILWPTHWKRPQCWERLKVGGKGDGWRWDGWITSLIQWIWMNKLWEIVKDKGAWGVAVNGVAEPDMI